MKDSGVEWIGEIPAGWEVKRLGSLFRERKTTVSATDFLPLSVTKQGVLPQLQTAAKSDSVDKRKLVLKGDFVINSRSDRKGSSGLASSDGSCSSIYIVLAPIGLRGGFAHQLLKSHGFQEEFYRWGSGIVDDLWSTRYEKMKMISVPVPPEEEMRAIELYLDQETSKIDLLISKKELLIEKLLERRQALITQVVTKGLDPYAPMKDSRVEWLGEIPENWTIAPLWTKATFSTGWTPSSSNESYFGQGIPWANISDLGPRFLRETSKTLSELGVKDYGMVPAKKGSLLFSFKLSIGSVSFADEDLYTNEAIAAFEESEKLSLRFGFYMLPLAVPENCSWNIYGARMLNETGIKQARLVLPSINEQEDVADFLDEKTTQIDKLIESTSASMKILKERRETLIAQVVTGKLDVRGLVNGDS